MHQPGAYDAMGLVMFGGRRAAVYRRLAQIAGIRPGDRVLDVACGTGALTRAAAALAGPTGHVTGVDLAPEMVAWARERSRIRRGAPTEFRAGDAAELPLPDASVDVVVSALAWHHLPEDARATAWQEALRVLRPGGRLLIAEFRAPGRAAGRAVANQLFGPAMAVDHTGPLLEEARAVGAVRPRVVRQRPWFVCLLAERAG